MTKYWHRGLGLSDENVLKLHCGDGRTLIKQLYSLKMSKDYGVWTTA